MCGIAGYAHSAPIDSTVIEHMTECLAHRGPDGRGIFVDPRRGIALGHRRLSIIDVDGGAQPMHSRCGRYVVVFNGEIYNHVELRRELEAEGARFATRCDTEILLKLYRRDGAAMCNQLNGMFALAIADLRDGSLFLARDPMGEKPLYYADVGGAFVFASEIKAILQFPGMRRRVDPVALAKYLSLNYVAGTHSMIEGIRRLSAGCSVTVRRGRALVSQYWHLPVSGAGAAPGPCRLDDAVGELNERLDEAVRLRLRSDVPVGLFLSSGVDTSLIASSLVRMGRTDLTAFSASFDDKRFDESRDAARTAGAQGLRFVHERVRPDPATLLNHIAEHADDPLGDSSAAPMGLICSVAAKHVKVILGGDGADELFGGYLTHRASLMARHYGRLPAFVRSWFRHMGGRLPAGPGKVSTAYKVRRFLERADQRAGIAHLMWNGAWTCDESRELLSADWRRRISTKDHLEQWAFELGLSGDRLSVDSMLAADQRGFLADDILVKTDRMSMAHGLEVRSPFLDRRLVEFAAGLPPTMKTTLRQGKVLLREAAHRRGLSEIARRPKQGFSVPIHAWLRGPLREPMLDLLSVSRLNRVAIFDSRAVQQRMDDHLNGRRDLGFELWGLMIFMAWHARYIERDVSRRVESHRMADGTLGVRGVAATRPAKLATGSA